MLSDAHRSYWYEVIEEAFCEEKIIATPEQIDSIAGFAECAHENYGMAFYQPSGPSQVQIDLDAMRKELSDERRKIHCEECNGTGTTHTYGGTFMSTSQCYKCRGEGRHAP